MKQMFRWAVQEYESAAGRENYGLPMEVKAEESEEGEVTAIVVDVKGVTTLRAQMDDEEVQVFDTVSKDKEGNAIPAHSMGKTVYEQEFWHRNASRSHPDYPLPNRPHIVGTKMAKRSHRC